MQGAGVVRGAGQGCHQKIWIYPFFAKFYQVLPSFTDFWTYSKAPPFASKNTKFWKKSVYRLIFGIQTTVAALGAVAGAGEAPELPLLLLVLVVDTGG